MTNLKTIVYDQENETVKNALINYINLFGVRQNFIADKISLSTCSVSLFLNGKRMLILPKLQEIKLIIGSK